jgi:hypothetical protein
MSMSSFMTTARTKEPARVIFWACVKLPFASLPLLINLLVWSIVKGVADWPLVQVEDLTYFAILVLGETIVGEFVEANRRGVMIQPFIVILPGLLPTAAAFLLGYWYHAITYPPADALFKPTENRVTFAGGTFAIAAFCVAIALLWAGKSEIEDVPTLQNWFMGRVLVAIAPCLSSSFVYLLNPAANRRTMQKQPGGSSISMAKPSFFAVRGLQHLHRHRQRIHDQLCLRPQSDFLFAMESWLATDPTDLAGNGCDEFGQDVAAWLRAFCRDVEVVESLPRAEPEVQNYLEKARLKMGKVPWPPPHDDPIDHFARQSVHIEFKNKRERETLLSIGGQCIPPDKDPAGSSLVAFSEDLILYCRLRDKWSVQTILSYADLQGGYLLVRIVEDARKPLAMTMMEVHISGSHQKFNVRPKALAPCEGEFCFGAPLELSGQSARHTGS